MFIGQHAHEMTHSFMFQGDRCSNAYVCWWASQRSCLQRPINRMHAHFLLFIAFNLPTHANVQRERALFLSLVPPLWENRSRWNETAVSRSDQIEWDANRERIEWFLWIGFLSVAYLREMIFQPLSGLLLFIYIYLFSRYKCVMLIAHARSDRSHGMVVFVSVFGHSFLIAFVGALHAAGIKPIQPITMQCVGHRLDTRSEWYRFQFSKKKKC